MRLLYDIFFILFALGYLPYLIVKGKLHGDFAQRFGFLKSEITGREKPVWIHAVSVGEAILAVKLTVRIKEKFPGSTVLISTTTETGNELAKTRGKGVVDGVFYFPLDISCVVSRVVRKIAPVLYITIETELWPNLMEELHRRRIPVVIANGRISDASFRNYSKVRFIMKRVLRNVDLCCMQSEKDAERILSLGSERAGTCVTGNMKFDELGESGKGYSKNDLGFKDDTAVIVAGSTHPSEEEKIMNVYNRLKKTHNFLGLVIAPRHLDRVAEIEACLDKKVLAHRRFSKGILPGSREEVIVVDTIGHLKDIYTAATVIFVGGSLVPKGGQNPIEGARLGKPVVFGPYMTNFRETAETFIENEAAIMVSDEAELFDVFDRLLKDSAGRARLGENAGRIVTRNAGAIERTVGKISALIAEKK